VVEMALLEHVLDANQGVGKTGIHLDARSPLHHLESSHRVFQKPLPILGSMRRHSSSAIAPRLGPNCDKSDAGPTVQRLLGADQHLRIDGAGKSGAIQLASPFTSCV
jgi:hypothetical protein